MSPETLIAIYDELVPGWRDAPLKGGERYVCCRECRRADTQR